MEIDKEAKFGVNDRLSWTSFYLRVSEFQLNITMGWHYTCKRS